jgi:hypothetical protein
MKTYVCSRCKDRTCVVAVNGKGSKPSKCPCDNESKWRSVREVNDEQN